ncbi:ribonuclease [Paenibacillus sp. FSL A5-0031]|uniref:YihY/virulence factor BrkB family protein n=1 Tax=Paenibacillus sp. FSL A5-0031 TaxID=1920420 RepID=UPI00096DD8DA|nr:YihY/virulence factor BrkB family protein [Paenibacillus sp. FSL A5-0031]OME88278.1 ribonuclease [Paenibacillus sp. FSL A5-0031]
MSEKFNTMQFIKCLYSRFREDDVPALGAQLTYYLILSFFPFLIFMVSLLSFIEMSGDSVIAEFIRLLPAEASDTISGILAEVVDNSSGTLLSFGMIATIWSASNGINAILKGLNKAYDVEEKRPFWKVRGISLLSTIFLVVVIVLVMVMLIFGKAIGEYLFKWLDYPNGFEWIWNVLKYVIPISAMTAAFSLLYWIVPNRRLSLKEAVPGAIFATFGWIATSLVFQFYMNNFGNYSKTYGSLGGVIILLIWLYISSILIMLGGEINATLASAKSKIPPNNSARHRFRIPLNQNKDIKTIT